MSGIALFEDSHWQSFSPITLTRAVFDVKVGARSFFEEYRQVPEILLTREYVAAVTHERHGQCRINPDSVDEDTVFVNGLLHPNSIDIDRLLGINHTFAIMSGNRLLVARLVKKGIEYLKDCVFLDKKIDSKKLYVDKDTQLGMQDAQGLLSEPWDIIRALENSLSMQVAISAPRDHLNVGEGVKVIGKGSVVVARDSEIEDGTVLDTRKGGIYIGSQSRVAPSRIVGPTYIGDKTQIKQFSVIETSSIGYNCRVAGEIEHSIISDHTNKAHAGFLGHSYVGEWANLGAMTTTSDLKMTYGDIKMDSPTGQAKVDTGMNKLGSFFADMCKTSVGTLVYSGRRIGVSCHLHGLISQDVPSFTIYGSSIGAKSAELRLDSAIETQRKMMARRDQKMSKAYEQMMREVFSMTSPDRKHARVRKTKFSL
ncbi:MAG TPA: putative sugar nucleotidyl transferase [Nitrososphaera sp.]|nr:putative sugar nucleotidyl transferase [Nitrososphaera sp.]